MRSRRFVMHVSLGFKPTRFPKVKKFAVARPTADHMLPSGVLLQILQLRRPAGEVSQYVHSEATAPFGIRIQRLHSLLVLTLHSIPLLFR
jgi:hypothetical protein